MSLGGDGVILHACTLFHSYVPPIIGFNLGSMGFLTNHEFETHRADLRGVLRGGNQLDGCDTDDPEQGGVHVTLRMRLLCEVYRRGQSQPSEVHEVLNEVVVDRGSSPFLSKIECFERGRLITRVQVWHGRQRSYFIFSYFFFDVVSPGRWSAAGDTHWVDGLQCGCGGEHGTPNTACDFVYPHLPALAVFSPGDSARLCRPDAEDPG